MNSKTLKKTIIVFVLVFAVAASLLTVGRIELKKKLEKPIFSGDDPIEDPPLRLNSLISGENCVYKDAFADDKRVNILILGVAKTVTGINLTDTIMLCSYDRVNYTVDVFSIPRDTYHYRPQFEKFSGNQRINAIYNSEGINGIAEAVSYELSNLPINYYVAVDYDDIKQLVDALDGVDVDVPFDLKYDDPYDDPPLHIDIKKGLQHIDSSNVVQLLRFRKTNPELAAKGYHSYNDTGRRETQQKFLKACIEKMMKKPSYIPKVLRTAMDCISSDLTYEVALELASDISEFSMENVHMYSVPNYAKEWSETGGVAFQWIDGNKLKTLLDDIFLPKAEDTSSGAAVQ